MDAESLERSIPFIINRLIDEGAVFVRYNELTDINAVIKLIKYCELQGLDYSINEDHFVVIDHDKIKSDS